MKLARSFLGDVSDEEISKFLNNLRDYGDNTLRYFRLTRFLYIRGGGFYVDLEKRRQVEITSLLSTDNAAPLDFSFQEEYREYISDINQPVLPWETDALLKEIARELTADLRNFEEQCENREIVKPAVEYREVDAQRRDELKAYIEKLREKRRKFQELLLRHEARETEKIEEYICQLRQIHGRSGIKKSIELEKLAALALNALNDAREISPNYPVGDDNEPTFTAPANKADIECFYDAFNAVCEVTMLTTRAQWYNEGQPVMRHVRDFEDRYPDKDAYCLFVAPRLHQDTVETFWMSVKYGYRGRLQKIVPLSITQLVWILNTLLLVRCQSKEFRHQRLLALYNAVIRLTDEVDHSDAWIDRIPGRISEWEQQLLNQA